MLGQILAAAEERLGIVARPQVTAVGAVPASHAGAPQAQGAGASGG
jgi:hypothetical protein